MTNNINSNDWLSEAEIPPMGGQPDMNAGGPPMSQPGMPGDPMGSGDQQMNVQDPNQFPEPTDISDDPQYPDMPEETEEDDFEIWKIKYCKESIKGEPEILIDMINSIRDRDHDPYPDKFLKDNINICLLRRRPDVLYPSTEIRKLIKKDLDRTNPASSLINHITSVLSQNISLNEAYIKISGLCSGKQDEHRKFIGALTGSVQTGSGGNNADLVFEEMDYSIRMSTRFNSKWGDVNIGRWYLNEKDPERYLKSAELDRLESGSPEEKDVLRRRVVIESITEMFRERAFIINVVSTDGTIQHLGWDLGTSLKSAYTNGKLVVRSRNSDANEAFINEEGSIVPIPNMSIYYVKETGSIGEHGKTDVEEIEFMEHRDGMLYLTAHIDLIKEASISIEGFVLKESPWQGNPTDLLRIRRCVPSSPEMILKQC